MSHVLDSVGTGLPAVPSADGKPHNRNATEGFPDRNSLDIYIVIDKRFSSFGPLFAAGLMAATMLAIFLIAPTEETMGGVQRILYIHVSVAWLGLLGFLVTAGTGLVYLVRRDFVWDHWSQSAAELGWLCCTLTLVTGSLWSSEAWNTWWTWDPRLTTAFVLWLIYSAYLLVRGSLDDVHRRARLSAVVAIIGVLDVPLVVMATRWFRGIHPVAPEMDPSMRAILILSAVSFTLFFALLLVRRQAQIGLENALAALEQRAGL